MGAFDLIAVARALCITLSAIRNAQCALLNVVMGGVAVCGGSDRGGVNPAIDIE